MSSSRIESRAQEVKVTADLTDGRTITVPLVWYPRLLHGTPAERNRWQLIGDGDGIHWPDLDEDIEVEALAAGGATRRHHRVVRALTPSMPRSRSHAINGIPASAIGSNMSGELSDGAMR